MTLTVVTCTNLGNWHGNRACACWSDLRYEKNNYKRDRLERDFGRHIHFADSYRRQAFLLEHQRRKR